MKTFINIRAWELDTGPLKDQSEVYVKDNENYFRGNIRNGKTPNGQRLVEVMSEDEKGNPEFKVKLIDPANIFVQVTIKPIVK